MALTIELLWGIVSKDPSEKEVAKNDGGIYQIYGTHPIYGRDVLLYIGLSTKDLDQRLEVHHRNWIKYEYDPVKVYYGTVVESSGNNDYTKKEIIARAEALLIYYCAPAYNSNLISAIEKKYLKEEEENIVVRNYGRIGSLPTEVSTAWYKSAVWKNPFFVK